MISPNTASRPSRRQPKVVLARETLDKLEALAEGALNRTPELADRLLEEIERAKVVSISKLRGDVVAIGRSVTYRDESTGQSKTVTLTFPEEADISEGRISLMTPVGVALIGLSEGSSFRWNPRDGEERSLTVLNVGPEA
ncbi:nucleoside diphosphate kinase regulator [Leisingera sp. F5]|uniref:nucleoside diphosphate kinase regulator n=1 Tax=Leisingera sp. F5 TaxID=1813816 RepID=UPI000B2C3077|nr:nucleoside diphosphate kinase regulator [Leisingera sp. F5]